MTNEAMRSMKIGIIKEEKVPIDRRVPLTPLQARELQENFEGVTVIVESSDIRCFSDEEYREAGIEVKENVDDCDIMLGVKEVPIPKLVAEKTYFFFSHTIKKQEYNLDLIRNILDKKIKLIDYETLTNTNGSRLIAFGRYAGIVGAYNGIYTLGKRYNLFHIRRAHECYDLEDLKNEFSKVQLPAVKIAVTGGGRVAKGAMEVLIGMGILKVSPAKFLSEIYHEPVFTQLNSRDYHVHKDGKEFSRSEFYTAPQNYSSTFDQYYRVTDLLIACAFWDPASPVLFKRQDILDNDFEIRVIADVTCDIEGSIPSTLRPSTIDDPVYDYNPSEHKVEAPYSDEANISVMAVDNLPCELPRDASTDFGRDLVGKILPNLLGDDEDGVIRRATIAEGGKLTKRYRYLQDWVDGKE